MKLSVITAASIFLLSFSSHATMTLNSISGDSNRDLSDPAKPIIYAGFTPAVACTGDGSFTCDSCTGTSAGGKLFSCNRTSAYPNLRLVIQMTSTNTTGTVYAKIGEDDVSSTLPWTFDSGVLTFQATWAEICQAAGVGNCDSSMNKDLVVGINTTSGGSATTDSMTFRLNTRVAAADGSDSLYTDCNTAPVAANQGFCHFNVFPGDEKLYVENMVYSDGYPASPAPGVEFRSVVFFYEPFVTDDNTTIASISNASSMFELPVNRSANPPIVDDRVDGLVNGQRYCMVMANMDMTGVISHFTPIPGSSGSPVTAAELCGTPAAVVGLLDDKSCFIATAAFGSQMAPEVESFREFRNKFLLPSKWGKAFVKFYYKHSPYYANLIAESEVAKAAVRAALWPLLLFARASVALGFWTAFALLSLGGVTIYGLYRRLILGRRFRGEL
ncbi:CFI-box-CTERM domain-containing protein [Bdellovibrio bacteriovorus]|uniref:CFI-box-CTERM domain-containing protein n=1 Tax=Bdellovibrio bacteriovorus TaxID=959 RepID=UPI0035A5F342